MKRIVDQIIKMADGINRLDAVRPETPIGYDTMKQKDANTNESTRTR